jgi:hypothetical protein
MEVDPLTTDSADHAQLHEPQRSGSFTGVRPRGILKNPASAATGRGLVWDEGNLALNEIQKVRGLAQQRHSQEGGGWMGMSAGADPCSVTCCVIAGLDDED